MSMELTRLKVDGTHSLYTRIANILGLEAGGGADPGEVLRRAIRQALDELKTEEYEQKAAALRKKAAEI